MALRARGPGPDRGPPLPARRSSGPTVDLGPVHDVRQAATQLTSAQFTTFRQAATQPGTPPAAVIRAGG